MLTPDRTNGTGKDGAKRIFLNASIDLSEILSGGPPKDGIPSIDDPQFISAAEEQQLAATEPVISLKIGEEARAYPLRILMWHEIVNDEVGGVPVTHHVLPAVQLRNCF